MCSMPGGGGILLKFLFAQCNASFPFDKKCYQKAHTWDGDVEPLADKIIADGAAQTLFQASVCLDERLAISCSDKVTDLQCVAQVIQETFAAKRWQQGCACSQLIYVAICALHECLPPAVRCPQQHLLLKPHLKALSPRWACPLYQHWNPTGSDRCLPGSVGRKVWNCSSEQAVLRWVFLNVDTIPS